MTLGSLFSGIGGIELGFERAGFKTVWQVEIDPYCRKVLAKHFPEAKRFEDVRECGSHNLEPVDVVAGGFPCQDISNAGKRAGIDGERSGLWSEFARIIGELRPRVVLVENVAALLGRGMGRVLGDLSTLGYDAEWQIISAADVGAPHLRERVWIVANAEREWELQQEGCERDERGWSGNCGEEVAYPPDSYIFEAVGSAIARRECGEWEPESNVGRVAHGIPSRVERLKGLGNAVVPQIPELIARRIAEVLK
jgi:DNA (cytosine-5)-methyltransferase 1